MKFLILSFIFSLSSFLGCFQSGPWIQVWSILQSNCYLQYTSRPVFQTPVFWFLLDISWKSQMHCKNLLIVFLIVFFHFCKQHDDVSSCSSQKSNLSKGFIYQFLMCKPQNKNTDWDLRRFHSQFYYLLNLIFACIFVYSSIKVVLYSILFPGEKMLFIKDLSFSPGTCQDGPCLHQNLEKEAGVIIKKHQMHLGNDFHTNRSLCGRLWLFPERSSATRQWALSPIWWNRFREAPWEVSLSSFKKRRE